MKSKSVFWNLWSSYAIYYFGKVNLSIVIPVLLATYGDLSLYNVGMVSTGFMVAYALGQFLHGQISERFNPFVYIAVGLLGSAVMNLLLGFVGGFFWMLLMCQIIDGGFQSMGWSSTVRANAMTSKNISRDSTYLGTAYQVGNSVAWLACSFMIGWLGWQWGFWAASVVMTARALSLLAVRPKVKIEPRPLKERMKLTIGFPIFMSALSLCLLNMVRYGVITWIPLYFYREFSMPIEKVGLSIFMIPIAGVAGTLLYNWLKLPKDVLTMIYMAALATTMFLMPGALGIWAIVLLVLSGLFLYGPHVFLVTTMPSRFVDQKIVASATGFIDGWGYVGAALIGVIVPFVMDKIGHWSAVFYLWGGISVAIIVMVLVVYIKSFRGESSVFQTK